MQQKPQKRRGALIFWLVFLAFATAVAATVLLANNRRNLNIVLRKLGIETRTTTMVIPKPGVMEAFKGKRLAGVAVMIPGQIFAGPVTGRDSAFLRSFAGKDGEGLCQKLRKDGFDMTPWEAGAFSQSLRECSYEKSIPNAEKPADPSTFFLMVKGNAAGDILSARAKVVIADLAAQPELAKRAADMLEIVARHTGWLELVEGAPKVAALTPFTISSSGIVIRFQSEFSGPGRYNLILSVASPLTPAQRRTRDYFDRKRYWPLMPEHGGPAVKIAPEPVEG